MILHLKLFQISWTKSKIKFWLGARMWKTLHAFGMFTLEGEGTFYSYDNFCKKAHSFL